MDLSNVKTESTLEENGVTVAFGDASVIIRSRQSEAYRKVVRRIFKPHESSIALSVLPDDVAKRLMIESAAEGLIVDWKGFTEKGEDVPYSVETAVRYLTDYTVFRNFVDETADKLDNFRSSKEVTEVKN